MGKRNVYPLTARYAPLGNGLDGHHSRTLDGSLLGLDGIAQLSKSDARGRADEQAEEVAEDHNDHEGNVGRVGDGAALRVVVQAEGDQRADAAAEVEDDPEDGDGPALLRLVHVRGHDGALDDPDERGADTQDGARRNDESTLRVVVEVQQTSRVQRVRPPADQEADARADPRKDRSDDEQSRSGCG